MRRTIGSRRTPLLDTTPNRLHGTGIDVHQTPDVGAPSMNPCDFQRPIPSVAAADAASSRTLTPTLDEIARSRKRGRA